VPLPIVLERNPAEDLPYAEASLTRAGAYVGVQWGEQLAVVDSNGKELRRVTTGPVHAWAFSSTGAIAWSSGRDLVIVQPDGTTRREELRLLGPAWLPRPAWAGEVFLLLADDPFLTDLAFTPDGSGLVIGTGYEMIRLDARTLAPVWRVEPEYGPLHIGFVGDTLWMSDAFANHLYDTNGRETASFGGGFATEMIRDDEGRLWTCSSPDMPALWDEAAWTHTYPFGTADLAYTCDYSKGRWLLDADLMADGGRFYLGHSTMEASSVFVGDTFWVADTAVVRRYHAGIGLVQEAFIAAKPEDLYGAFYALERGPSGLWHYDADEGVVHGPFGVAPLGLEDPVPTYVSLGDGAWIVDASEVLARVTPAGAVSKRPFPEVSAAARLPNGRWVAIGGDPDALGPVVGRKVRPRVPVNGWVRRIERLRDGRLAWADDEGVHLTDPARWTDTLVPTPDLAVEYIAEHDGRLLLTGVLSTVQDERVRVTDLLDANGARIVRIPRDYDQPALFLPDGSFLAADQDLRWFGPEGVERRAWRVASAYGFADLFLLADGTIAATQRWDDGHRWWSVDVARSLDGGAGP
jgi:hypothetical protein